jgi:hypothetical protein
VSDIEHELIATLWDLKVAKDRIDKLTKSNLQLREGAEEQKQRIMRLEEAGDVLAQRSAQLGLLPMAIEGWNKAKEAKP